MSSANIKRASLAEITRMRERGELFHDPNAPEGPDLGKDFWKHAMVMPPLGKRSVHLRLDPGIFEYFMAEAGGKGHLTRMQDVLKSYVNAKRNDKSRRLEQSKTVRRKVAAE